MEQEYKYDAYISYNHRNQSDALYLWERLTLDGLRVWIDKWGIKPGDDWRRKIEDALLQSRAVIPLVSFEALNGEGVRDEWNHVLKLQQDDPGRRIIPVLLDDAELPENLEGFFAIDFRSKSDEQYKRLLDACRALIEERNRRPGGTETAPQFWLVSINDRQFERKEARFPRPIFWNEATGGNALRNVKQARPDDVVLACQTDSGDDSITGVGSILLEAGLYGANEIVIRLDRAFETPIPISSLTEIAGIEIPRQKGNEPVFSKFDPYQWSLVRPIILAENSASIGSDDLPPADAGAARTPRARIEAIEIPGDIIPGKEVDVDLRVRNLSNFAWRKGDSFPIIGDIIWRSPRLDLPDSFKGAAILSSETPPGAQGMLSGLGVIVPSNLSADARRNLSVLFDLELLSSYKTSPLLKISDWRVDIPDTTAVEKTGRTTTQVEESTYQQSPWTAPPSQQAPADNYPNQTGAANDPPPGTQQPEAPAPTIESKTGGSPSTASQSSSAPHPESPPAPPPAPPPAQLDLAPQIVIMQQRYAPLPDEIKVNIEISSKFVTLEYGDQQFNSPNRISQQTLIELESGGRLREYGEALFKAIFNDESTLIGGQGKTTFRGYSAAINDDDARGKARIVISLDQAALDGTEGNDLFDIWWEYLKDPQSDVPLSVSERAPFYRLQGRRPSPSAVDALPLKILVAICNPVTLGQTGSEVEKLTPLNIEQECDIIERALKRLKDAQLADYDILHSANGGEAVTLFNLQQKLKEGYHALHLISHGAYSRKLGAYCLVMENDQREHDLVAADSFTAPLLTENLRLITLACCQSGDYSTGKAFQSLGPRLVHLGAPAVIAMQDFVPVTTAQLFTQHFYDDLARSGRVDMAMAATRFALYSRYRGESREWAIPVLLMCNDDGKLFNVDRRKAAQLEELRPDVKTYNQLPGGDPTTRKLAQVFETEARNQRIDENTVSLLHEAISAVMRGAALKTESEPVAPQQDRRALSDIIKRKVRINPSELRKHVEESGSRLELPGSVYQQVASALNTGKHVIFIGPPGTGKTSLANDICAFAKKEGFTTGVRPTTATADWSTFDTVGGYTPGQDQTLQFRPGIFLRAICEAEWLVIDEINRAEIDKAFGELFTALSGQGVDLPYWVGEKQVRVLPPEKDFDQWWSPDLGARSYDFVMHPNWRIVAAMNAYDKSSLYALSFAFMRRFAFIDIDVPGFDEQGIDGYHKLLERWMKEFGLPELEETRAPLRVALQKLIARDGELMRRRALGPAILRDIIRHIGDRRDHDDQADLRELLCEAFLLHAAPQLDGIERAGIFGIKRYLQELFVEQKITWGAVSARIHSLYPHITESEWTDGQN